MSNSLSQTAQPTLIRPERSLGSYQFDIVVEENHEDTLVITEHPAEQGAPFSDHAYKKPATVTIRGGVTDVGSSLNATASDGDTRVVSLYEKLLELQDSKEPFEIVTGLRRYENMLLETLSVPVDQTGSGAAIMTANCRQVFIVKTQSTSVPSARRHANAAKTGGVNNKGKKQLQSDKRSAFAEAAGGGYRRPGGPA